MEIWDLYDRDAKKTGETWERTYGSFRLIQLFLVKNN